MVRLRTQLQRLGPHFRTVLMTGETGTGKELAARELHRFSPHAEGPFVVFDAASVGEAVIEWQGSAEALPTAADDMDSLLRAAHRGTLYFDQIGEMPAAMQAQLLHVLQQRERIARGSNGTREGGARIIGATSQDLRALMSLGRFREDLYYRIATVEVALPPLRERVEDVPALTRYFLERCGAWLGRDGGRITGEALDRLMQYAWPGNVRELENLVLRGLMESRDGAIDVQHVDRILDGAGESRSKDASHGAVRLQEVIERHVLHVLKCCGGNKVRAAEELGISRSTLYRMLDACAASATG
jgi:DNA-binding NtrC family response regulator